MRRLSTGLIAYGVIGLIVAAIAFGALVWVNDRIGTLRTEVDTTIARLATTTDDTAAALRNASTTAKTFSTTLDQAATAMPAISDQIGGLRADLSSLEAQLRSVNILGATPLGSAADAVGKISASLEGMDTQLALVGVALTANSQALAANATSLGRLADSTDAIATRLGSGVIEDSLGDVQLVIVVTLLVLTALSLVPAVGALAFGVWLRRELVSVETGQR
jgi:uncharacterized phage infection (PIP) family protein YhgE